MFKNYITIACRNLLRKKGYSLINISGLTIGIASCILIVLFVSSELSYDRYHEKSDRIYRVGIEALFGDNHIFSAVTSGAMKDGLEYEFSEVEQACRLYYATNPVVITQEDSFPEDNFFFADSNFFDVFTVPLISGNPSTVLNRPNTVVITKETAEKYFGDVNPVGKTISFNEQYEMEITGISENMPANSHFRYDFLGSLETLRPDHQQYWENWTSNSLYTYFVLNQNTGKDAFSERLQELVYNYVAPEVERTMGVDINSFEAEGGVYKFYMEPLTDIHLHSDSDNQLSAGGSVTTLYFFSIIAVLILLIACINFMNLATARYTNRAKEVGVRKTLGGSKKQLIMQFLTESVLVSLIAVILATALVELSLPFFNNITSKSFELNYINNWFILPALILLGLFTGVLAGSYPAFFLSSFKTVNILKGVTDSGTGSNKLRKILVVAQFSITIALLAATFLVFRQLDYWQSQDPGYESEGIVVLQRTHILEERQNAFREELLKNEGIVNGSFCSALPSYNLSGTSLHKQGSSAENLVQTSLVWADEHYLETMGLELSEGRFFSSEYGTDNESVVINEALVRTMGIEDPTQNNIVFPHLNLVSPVAGVIKDSNFESMHRNIRPMTIQKLENQGWYMAIKINHYNIPSVIGSIEQTWNEFTVDAPFIWTFLEDDIMAQYNNEVRTKNIFSIFSMLAIFIACLGLLGMASFTTEKRTKEIGVRKAMGASSGSIIILLSKEINLLIFIATLIGWPVAWYFMDGWLNNFAYRIDLPPSIFIAASVLTYTIALATVGLQSYRAAQLNPVDTLRNE